MPNAKATILLQTISHKYIFPLKTQGKISSVYLVKGSCIGETAFPYLVDNLSSMHVVSTVWSGS